MPGHGGPFAITTGRLEELEAMVSMGDSVPRARAPGRQPGLDRDAGALHRGDRPTARHSATSQYEITGLWTKQERSEFAGAEGGQGGRGGGDRGPCTYTISVPDADAHHRR